MIKRTNIAENFFWKKTLVKSGFSTILSPKVHWTQLSHKCSQATSCIISPNLNVHVLESSALSTNNKKRFTFPLQQVTGIYEWMTVRGPSVRQNAAQFTRSPTDGKQGVWELRLSSCMQWRITFVQKRNYIFSIKTDTHRHVTSLCLPTLFMTNAHGPAGAHEVKPLWLILYNTHHGVYMPWDSMSSDDLRYQVPHRPHFGTVHCTA